MILSGVIVLQNCWKMYSWGVNYHFIYIFVTLLFPRFEKIKIIFQLKLQLMHIIWLFNPLCGPYFVHPWLNRIANNSCLLLSEKNGLISSRSAQKLIVITVMLDQIVSFKRCPLCVSYVDVYWILNFLLRTLDQWSQTRGPREVPMRPANITKNRIYKKN